MVATELETEMLAKGFASVRMVVLKTRLSKSTVSRLVRLGELEGFKVGHLTFIKIASVAVRMGPEATTVLKLKDWSDVCGSE